MVGASQCIKISSKTLAHRIGAGNLMRVTNWCAEFSLVSRINNIIMNLLKNIIWHGCCSRVRADTFIPPVNLTIEESIMTKSKLLNTLILAALAVPGMAMAEEASPVSANVGFTTDYIFRGIAQTSHNPAVQGGIDYAHSSGFYAGMWGSNVSWIADSGAVATGSVTMELDTYLGFSGSITEDIGYNVGAVRYNYLGDYTAASGFAKADTSEVYGSVSYKFLTAKYSYSLGDFLAVPEGKGSNYIELNASYDLGDTGINLGAHVGKQTFKPDAAKDYTYTDYKVSASKDFSGYVVGLAYTSTNVKPVWTFPSFGGDWGKSVVALSVTHAM